jgi:hypothetical protein
MTNFEIYNTNKDKSSELIKCGITIEDTEECKQPINLKIDYNYIEIISMLSYENRIFYEKNISLKGTIITDKDTNCFYNVYFEPLIYYENVSIKYEAVFTLIRRKNSKDVIIHALYEMIKASYSIKILKIIFNKIVKQLHKNLYNKSIIGNFGNLTSNETEEKKNSFELLNPKHFVLLRKKTIVKQPDIYYNLFKPFEYKQVFFKIIF